MTELSIKLKIADREYPMRVSPEEEEVLRLAGRHLNERLKLFKEQFGVADKQDLLAMVAIEATTEHIKNARNSTQIDTSLTDRLEKLNNTLNALELE